MNKALLISTPHSKPHISNPLSVFLDAFLRKLCRRSLGKKTGRSGSPFSRYRLGAKVTRFGSSRVLGGRAGAVSRSGVYSVALLYEANGSFCGLGGGFLGLKGATRGGPFGGRGGSGLGPCGTESGAGIGS